MKKILIFLILLFIPCLVFADSETPLYTTYDVLVSNKSGATAYNSDKTITIPFDTKLTVIYESNTSIDGKSIDCVIVKYNSKEYKIDANDVTVYSETINLDDYKKEEKKLYFFQDEVNIYKGPSKVYGKISGKIPKGTVLTTKYYDYNFAYVEYQNIKGWIFSSQNNWTSHYPNEYNNCVLFNSDEKKVMTIFETELVDIEDNKIKVPAETYLSYEFYSYNLAVVNYNDKDYFLYFGNVLNPDKNIVMLVDEKKEVLTTKEIEIYDSFKNKNVIGTIPANEVITLQVIFDESAESVLSKFYVNYNGTKGLIIDDSAWYIQKENKYHNLSKTIQIDLYQYKKDEKPIKTISIDSYYLKWNAYDWYYIESNDNKGWIKVDDIKSDVIDKANEEETNKDKETNKNIFSNISIKELAIYIVVGTLLISLTAFVTIKLVNKNKKEKVDNKEVLNENTIKEETKKEDTKNEI